MKKILTLLIAFLCTQFLIGQSVNLDCPDEAEIGISTTFTANFDDNQVDGVTVQRYIWTVPWNGEGISGPNGINGNLDGGTSDPLTISTSSTSNTITVLWGDFFEPCSDDVEVEVHYRISGEPGLFDVTDVCSVDLFCIETPFITGTNSIPRCCANTVTYCDNSGGKQNFWAWSITGGTFASNGGTTISGTSFKCVDVTPGNNGTITLTCTSSRQGGNPAYTKTSTKTVTRSTPQTSAISGQNFACQGENLVLCVNEICGMTGATWTVPSSFQVVSGQGTACITLTPNPGAANGTTATITARALLNGGCTATTSSHDLTIYTTEIPPCPDGYPVIIFEDDYDPCADGNVYLIEFITDNPYINGYTTVSPTIVIDVPHHNVGDRIDVTVCNVNICSGEKCCVDYLLFLPLPCTKDELPGSGGWMIDNGETDPNALFNKTDSNPSFNETGANGLLGEMEIQMFPNPIKDVLFIKSNIPLEGTISIFNLQGNKVLERALDGRSSINLDLSQINVSGTYFALIQNGGEVVTKKIVVVK